MRARRYNRDIYDISVFTQMMTPLTVTVRRQPSGASAPCMKLRYAPDCQGSPPWT